MAQSALRSTDHLDTGEFLHYLDARPNERWELHDGVPRAMVGSTFAHAVIATNLVAALKPLASRRGCQALTGYLIEATKDAAYEPDAMVVCDVPNRSDRKTDRPTIVFEVLSPSTMHFDRSEKARRYRAIPSLRQIVFVYQDSVRVESWLRNEDGWSSEPTVLIRQGDSLALPAIAGSLPVSAVYADVAVPSIPSD